MLTRRALAPLGLLAALCTPARAQPAAAGVRMPPLPCATQPGDIVGLLLDGSGAPAGRVRMFRPGLRPRASPCHARWPRGWPTGGRCRRRPTSGTATPTARPASPWSAWPRPPCAGRARRSLALARGPGRRGPAAGRRRRPGRPGGGAGDLPPDGGTPARHLLDLFRAGLAGGRAWQAGPLAVEARGTVRIPAAAVGGGASPRLVADVADPRRRHAVGRRRRAQRPGDGGPGRPHPLRPAAAAGLRDAGRFLDAPGAVPGLGHHARRAAWPARAPAPPGAGRCRLPGRPGRRAPLRRGRRHRRGAAARMAQAMAAPDWAVPFARRGLTQYMPTSGGRPEIGPATLWQAAWLVSGDPRAAAHALGQAEAAGAVPWHYWGDEAHGPGPTARTIRRCGRNCATRPAGRATGGHRRLRSCFPRPTRRAAGGWTMPTSPTFPPCPTC